MRLETRALSAAALLAAAMSRALHAQQPAPSPTPPPAEPPVSAPAPPEAAAPSPPPVTESVPAPGSPPPPPAAPSIRLFDAGTVTVAKLPSDNPYGGVADSPAALPGRLSFADATLPAGFFVSVRVDAAGKPLSVRRDRDPIPSLAAESMKSIQRWTIVPARRAGQAVETWGAYRLELQVEIDAPKVLQATLTPVTPATPLPAPFPWPPETDWLESRHPPLPSDGSVSILEVDTAPIPQKTPWTADSYKGPFSVKYWIKVDKNGRIERAIPLEVTDPVLLAYFRGSMTTWVLRPAQLDGAPVDSWNELSLSGQISLEDEIKQIAALRRATGP